MTDINFKTVMVISKVNLDEDLSKLKTSLQSDGRKKDAKTIQDALHWMEFIQDVYNDARKEIKELRSLPRQGGKS